ncbi:MAG: GGDEF domain-containing phosphodiesterase [Lachnospiraceae bacterium]|nr:GGDEF domain-containing phosphodiesterase [Lachnospiraceae bacterium]
MDDAKREQYYVLFEKMVDNMVVVKDFSREELVKTLSEICELFHIAKGVTEFYRSAGREKLGDGEVMVDYDNGRAEKVVLSKRVESMSGAIIKGTLYMANDDFLDNEELQKVDVMLRALMAFISRNRLSKAIVQVGFNDEMGYPNFRAFMRFLERAQDDGEISEYTAIRFNLKQFSVVNQDIGRDNADVAMRRYFHLVETVIEDDGIACRIGGDNFAAVFKKDLLGSILEILRGVPVVYDKEHRRRIYISASVGVYEIPGDFGDTHIREVMDRVSSAEAVAKRADTGYVIFYDAELRKQRDNMMRIRRMFPRALGNGEFVVYYQPKVNIRTGQIVGVEALCRWVRDGRVIPPMEFIPIIEQTTEICDLDFYVLDRVCKDLRAWLDTHETGVRASVNLSRKHLLDTDLLEHILQIIDRNQVPHEYIEIELTETTTDVRFKDLRRVAQGLQQAGIRTSVDDFGMGYSSLNLIREIDWDVLKIDRSFLPKDEEAAGSITSIMFRHVVSMAQAMGLECIAEGVETENQIKCLLDNNCEIAQGFYFDKPLPKEKFEAKLEEGKYEINW